MTPSVAAVIAALHTIAPPSLAESWDNVGLLVGDPAAPCPRALVALDVDEALVRRAARLGARLIISHHPPIFSPIHKLTADTPSGRLLLRAAQNGIALAAAHTNYDVAPGGVSDVLAELLDLRRVEPLTRAEASAQAKLVIFTPASDLDAVIRALGSAGAGAIGQYRDCTFRAPGTGTFRGLADSRPAVGQAGRFEEAPEFRLETVVPLALAERAAAAARAAHSYEEPAVDVYPLAGGRLELGLGRCGDLPRPMQAGRLLSALERRLGVERIRTTGDLRRTVRRVAVLGGAGGKYVEDAARRGCQLYVTGDVSHHQALAAEAAGLVVADAGHAGTEAPAIPALARRLGELCPGVRFTPVAVQASGPLR